MGAPPAWSARRRSAVPMRLPDLGPGVQQIVPLTEIGERVTGGVQISQIFRKWVGTETPIAPAGRYRARVALLADGEQELRHHFFAVSCSHPNFDDQAVAQIIAEKEFRFPEEWAAEAP
jgi:hypothetical protein